MLRLGVLWVSSLLPGTATPRRVRKPGGVPHLCWDSVFPPSKREYLLCRAVKELTFLPFLIFIVY